jgi:hypothetical protein
VVVLTARDEQVESETVSGGIHRLVATIPLPTTGSRVPEVRLYGMTRVLSP